MNMLDWGAGLRLKLVVLLLIALIPVFGLFAYVATRSQATSLELARANLESEALLAAASQQRLLDRVAQLLGDMASGPSIRNPGTRLCGPYLRNLQAQNSRYLNLGLIGLDGKVVCQSHESAVGTYLGDRNYFRGALATGKFSVGEYTVARIAGQPAIGFGMPVLGDDGVVNGVAYASIDVQAVSDALADGPVLTGSKMRVLDRHGIILAAYPQGDTLQGKPEQDEIILRALGKPSAAASQTPDPQVEEHVYAHALVGGRADSLLVTVSLPLGMITEGPRMELYRSLLVLLGMAAFGIGCAWAVGAHAIVRPTHEILKSAHELTLGNLAARISLGAAHRGEFGAIGTAFNRMADALQSRGNDVNAALRATDAERTLLDLIVNSMSEGVVAADANGRILLLNATASRLFSTPGRGDALDDWRREHQLVALDGKTPLPRSEWPLERAIGGASTDNLEMIFRQPGTGDRIFRLSARPLRDARQQLMGGVLVFNDVTELKVAENLMAGQKEVLALIASGRPLPDSLQAIVRLMEAQSPGSLCSILLVEGKRLVHGATADLPASFSQQIEGLPVGEGSGACGTSAYRKQPVIVEDTRLDPLMTDFQEVTSAYDLQACWSVPVLSADGSVLATFAIYRHTPGVPQPVDLELMDIASRLARVAIESERAEAALLRSEARFRELAENIQDVFYSVDIHTGQMLYISPGYEKIWGRSAESLYTDPRSYAAPVLPADMPQILRARDNNRAGRRSEAEYRIRAADGRILWIRDRGYPVLGADGKLERVVGIARDITERKRAEAALGNTNRALQMLSLSSIAINRIRDENSLLAEVCRVAVEVGGYRLAWIGYAMDDARRNVQAMAFAGEEQGYLQPGFVSWDENRRSGQGPVGRAIRSGQASQSGDIASEESTFLWRAAALERGYRSAICLPLRDAQRSFGVLCMYSGEVQQFPEGEIKLLQEFADNLAFGIGSVRAQLEKNRNREAARLAEIRLREQASLLDHAKDAIMVRNLDRTLRYWNKGAEHLYGWTAQEVMGKTMDEVMYRDPQILADAMALTVAGGGDWSGELEQLARDGSTVYIGARWTVVRDEDGTINGVLGINTDIGERRRAREEILRLNTTLEERVLKRTAQLEFANQQLEAFSYSVSHDLRTPLSSVDGFSNLLEKNLAGIVVEGAIATRNKHYLTRIRAGVSRMGQLIDAMLSLAHVSRSSLLWEQVDLSAQAQALLGSYREQAPQRAVEIVVQPGLTAQGDPRLLNQVLDNLLGNAWKFSAGQSPARITFGSRAGGHGENEERGERTGEGERGELVYFVSDNGAGFDMAYSDKLFGAFQRLHSAEEFTGTGIGLATVQRIIARHGGRVWGESAPGEGATFYFTLGTARL